MMTEVQVRSYLRENGYPEHIVRGGRQGLIDRWRQFVDEVEHGYEFGLEDYRNDLDIRAILRMLDADAEVAEADERFHAMLTALEARVWESADSDPWWDFGYPRNVSSQLKKDLRAEGLLEA
jgi:hypothetical protein